MNEVFEMEIHGRVIRGDRALMDRLIEHYTPRLYIIKPSKMNDHAAFSQAPATALPAGDGGRIEGGSADH